MPSSLCLVVEYSKNASNMTNLCESTLAETADEISEDLTVYYSSADTNLGTLAQQIQDPKSCNYQNQNLYTTTNETYTNMENAMNSTLTGLTQEVQTLANESSQEINAAQTAVNDVSYLSNLIHG